MCSKGLWPKLLYRFFCARYVSPSPPGMLYFHSHSMVLMDSYCAMLSIPYALFFVPHLPCNRSATNVRWLWLLFLFSWISFSTPHLQILSLSFSMSTLLVVLVTTLPIEPAGMANYTSPSRLCPFRYKGGGTFSELALTTASVSQPDPMILPRCFPMEESGVVFTCNLPLLGHAVNTRR